MTARAQNRKSRGFNLIELLIALSISAALLVAVTAAINASFYAYASAAESASAQSSTRLAMQRILMLIRNTTLHDAYDPDDPGVSLGAPAQPPVQTIGIQMVDPDGRYLRIWWAKNDAYDDADLGDLWYRIDASASQPLLEQVRIQRTATDKPYLFALTSRLSDDGLILHRATVDLTVEPGADATLALEDHRGAADAVRIVASTMPRRNLR